MLDHPRIAMIAAHLIATGPAERNWRITTTIDKEQGLFPRLDACLNHLLQLVRYPTIGRQGLLPHINRHHLRQNCRAETAFQFNFLVFSRLDIGPTFETGRCAGQHHLPANQRPAQHGHVPRIV